MRIFCKGFNLYNQLNRTEHLILEFQPCFYLEPVEFVSSYTFSAGLTDNQITFFGAFSNGNLPQSEEIRKIKQISISDRILLILNDRGRLFKTKVDNWQIEPLPIFTDCDKEDKVEIVSLNSKLTAAYTENGLLYNIPEKLEFCNKDIIDLKTGREHGVLLDKWGNVYTFGSGSRGQLGTGSLEDKSAPVVVQALAGIKIVAIAVGGWHSAAISQDGDLYTWGWNGCGQLGLGSSNNETKQKVPSVMATPHVVDIDNIEKNVVQVACGSKHTIVLLANGMLYGCGWNKYKQLKDDDQENYHSFVFVHDFSKENIHKLICGPWNSAVVCS